MSNFLRRGNREASKSKRKLLKRHQKAFWNILERMDELAKELILHEETVTEENIQQLAVDYYGRELDAMEQMLILSKIDNYNEVKHG